MKQGTAPLILEGENHTLNLKGKSAGIRIEGKTIQVPNPDYDPTDEEYDSPYFEVYPNLVLVSRKLKEINIAVDGTLPESRGIYVKDTDLQLRRYLGRQGGSDGKIQ